MGSAELIPEAMVTVVGPQLTSDFVQQVVMGVQATGGQCRAILTLAPGEAVRLDCTGASVSRLREALHPLAQELRFGLWVASGGLAPRLPRLWVMDVDSTLIEQEVIDELGRAAGCMEAIAKVTARAMNGEMDFAESLVERCALLRGLPVEAFERVRSDVRVRTGARRLIRALRRVGCRTGVVSGGFIAVVEPLAEELGIHHAVANDLEVADGRLTGHLRGPLIDAQAKVAFIDEHMAQDRLQTSQVVAVGDGANDLPMLLRAGLGIAFGAKPEVRRRAPTFVDLPRLDATTHHLGWSLDDLEQLSELH